MSRPKKLHPTPERVVTLNFLYVFLSFSLIALACSAVTDPIDNLIPDSGVGPGPSGIGGPTRPVGFVNHGSFIAVVIPWTFVPLDSNTPDTPPDVSTVSSVPTSPGLWPNPSRFLSLPFGTYTWCFEWDEGDLDNDSLVDYFHFFDARAVTVDENAPDDPDLAIQVDFSAPPSSVEILSGPCGDEPVTGLGNPWSPLETPEGEIQPAPTSESASGDDYPHIYKGELKLDSALGICTRMDYFKDNDPPLIIEKEENEVVLSVDAQGNINGTMKTRHTVVHQDKITATSNAEEYIGDCEGAITETGGYLLCSLTQQFFVYCDDCGPPGFPKNPFEESFYIKLSDNKIIGTRLLDESSGTSAMPEDCFSFVVSKQ